MNTLLTIQNVNVNYGDKAVLRNVDVQVNKNQSNGQIVGFLGPSGVGKSTLFRVISGLQEPTSGHVLIGQEQKDVRTGQVGMVAQSYPLLDHRTVFSNLLLSASQVVKDPKEARDRVNEYLNEFDLQDQTHSYPAQLSGGQKQRVAILQQILCSDHFLLLDEPFSGLDMIMIEKTSKLITKVARLHELNTIIVCSHDISATCAVADHIWMMGRERDASNQLIPGARIVKQYDLVAQDLCWHPDILSSSRFIEFVAEVKNSFRSL